MEIRRAAPADYAGICELARANHKDNLSAEAQRNGFLSAKFSLQQIADIGDDLGIIIASEAGQVAGFMCASRGTWPGQPPIVLHMLAQLPQFSLRDRMLQATGVFVYGPVCIAAAQRGRGLLRRMYQCLQHELRGAQQTGVAFVADDNIASLQAHVAGLGMLQVGGFSFAERGYQVLAFDIVDAA